MKYFRVLLILMSGLFMHPTASFAVIKTQSELSGISNQTDKGSTFKTAKRKAGFWTKIKRALDFGDSVSRWLLFALILLGGAVVFGALRFGAFAGILGVGAFICFVVWFLKYSNVI